MAKRPIANTVLTRIRPGGERVPLTVEIGRQYRARNGTWRTPIKLKGLDRKIADIAGEDSFQSLCLALRMAHSRLAAVIAEGDKPAYDDGSEFPLEAYFPKF